MSRENKSWMFSQSEGINDVTETFQENKNTDNNKEYTYDESTYLITNEKHALSNRSLNCDFSDSKRQTIDKPHKYGKVNICDESDKKKQKMHFKAEVDISTFLLEDLHKKEKKKTVCEEIEESAVAIINSSSPYEACSVVNLVTNKVWTGNQIVKCLNGNSSLSCWTLTSSVNGKTCYVFGLPDVQRYVTAQGAGEPLVFGVSNVDPTDIDVNNGEEINDYRAFYYINDYLVPAFNTNLAATVSAETVYIESLNSKTDTWRLV